MIPGSRFERERRPGETNQSGGISARTALLALLAVVIAGALLYQLLNWRPSSMFRSPNPRGTTAQIRG